MEREVFKVKHSSKPFSTFNCIKSDEFDLMIVMGPHAMSHMQLLILYKILNIVKILGGSSRRKKNIQF